MRKHTPIEWVIILSLGLAGCNFPGRLSASPVPPTLSPSPPTATPIPLAASFHGGAITLEAYETEVARYEQAQTLAGIDLATLPGYRARVLDALIDLQILAAGATQAGVEVLPEEIETRIGEVQAARGSQEAFSEWLSENDYDLDSFRAALTEQVLAAQMVSLITATVSQSAEQAHARHILVATSDEGARLRERITAGEAFHELAQTFSLDASTRPAGGDMGWFPRGYLLWPEVDAAVFELEPGGLSAVIESELGYHLVELLEREEHHLDYEAWLFLQDQAVQNWLSDQKETADVQLFIEP